MSVESRLEQLEKMHEASDADQKKEITALKKQAATLEKLAASAGKLGFDDLIKVMLAVITISGFISGGVMFVVNAKTAEVAKVAEDNADRIAVNSASHVTARHDLRESINAIRSQTREYQTNSSSTRSELEAKVGALTKSSQLSLADRWRASDQRIFATWLKREMDLMWRNIEKGDEPERKEND